LIHVRRIFISVIFFRIPTVLSFTLLHTHLLCMHNAAELSGSAHGAQRLAATSPADVYRAAFEREGHEAPAS
jgi:hypothetical protein